MHCTNACECMQFHKGSLFTSRVRGRGIIGPVCLSVSVCEWDSHG